LISKWYFFDIKTTSKNMQNDIQINLVGTAVTLLMTLAALALAGYFALRRRVLLAVVSMGCFLMLFNPTAAMAEEICKPIRYADGDTFNFKRADGELVRVRLAGYDAVERGQPFSRRATEKLRSLTAGGARCDCYKTDRYGRSVCNVRTLAGEHVAPLMLAAGYACIDPRFENEAKPADRAAARAALADAQARKVGMWSVDDAQCPADFRREKRNAQR
jgi:endonuclease YncB( thermonuclease family)